MKLRAYLTLALAAIILLVGDPVQRIVVVGLTKLMPGRRDRILTRWQRLLAHVVLGLVQHVGGAKIEPLPRIRGRAGVLILMNHQSLLDIPLIVAALKDVYPRIVTRERYARGKPLISHMIRLYQYPLVDPGATSPGQLERIGRAAEDPSTPLVIYPEGTRTRDGGIGRFKRGGLARILMTRQWTVYVVVADGFWQANRLEDFASAVGGIRGRMICLGPFESPPADEPPYTFIEEMRQQMIAGLAELRGEAAE